MNPENGSAKTDCVCALNVNTTWILSHIQVKINYKYLIKKRLDKRRVQNSFNFANYPHRRPQIFCVQTNLPVACSRPIFRGRGDQLFPVFSGGWSGCPRQFWVYQRYNGEELSCHSRLGREAHSWKNQQETKFKLVKRCSRSN